MFKKSKKVISAILSIALVMSILPMLPVMSSASFFQGAVAGTTGSGKTLQDPVIVDTYDEWVKTMQSNLYNYISVANDIKKEVLTGDVALSECCAKFNVDKHLYLNGHTISLTINGCDGMYGASIMIYSRNGSSLEIYGDGGSIVHLNWDSRPNASSYVIRLNEKDNPLIDKESRKGCFLLNNVKILNNSIFSTAVSISDYLNCRFEDGAFVESRSGNALRLFKITNAYITDLTCRMDASVKDEYAFKMDYNDFLELGIIRIHGDHIITEKLFDGCYKSGLYKAYASDGISCDGEGWLPPPVGEEGKYKYAFVKDRQNINYVEYGEGVPEDHYHIIATKEKHNLTGINCILSQDGSTTSLESEAPNEIIHIVPVIPPDKTLLRIDTVPKSLKINTDNNTFIMPATDVSINFVLANPVKKADLTINTPTVYESLPQNVLKIDNPQTIKNNSIKWSFKSNADNQYTEINDLNGFRFTKGHIYKVTVTLEANDGYGFEVNKGLAATINGNSANVISLTPTKAVIEYEFTEVLGEIVEETKLFIENYHAGSKITDLAIRCENYDNISISGFSIKDNNGNKLPPDFVLGSDGCIDYEIEYKLKIIGDNFVFSEDLIKAFIEDKAYPGEVTRIDGKNIKVTDRIMLDTYFVKNVDITVPSQAFAPCAGDEIPQKQPNSSLPIVNISKNNSEPINKQCFVVWYKLNERTYIYEETEDTVFTNGKWMVRLYLRTSEPLWQGFNGSCTVRVNGIDLKAESIPYGVGDGNQLVIKIDDIVIDSNNLYETKLISGSNYEIVKFNGGAEQENVSVPRIINGHYITKIGGKGEADSFIGAFQGNTYIKNLRLPESIKYIGQRAFKNCTNMKFDFLNGPKFMEIEKEAFFGCASITGGGKSINLPGSLERIGENAFNGVDARTIGFPGDINYVAQNAFINCPNLQELFTYDYPTMNYLAVNGNLYKCNADNKYDKLIYHCENNTQQEPIINNYTNGIGEVAFKGCKFIKNVTLPDSVTYLGYGAFENCANLEKINLSENLTTIYNYAFKNCPKLKAVLTKDNIENVNLGAINNSPNAIFFINKYSLTDNSNVLGAVKSQYRYYGDIVNDYNIDDSDYQQAVNMALADISTVDKTQTNSIAADTNCDGVIDVLDLVNIKNAVNNGQENSKITELNLNVNKSPSQYVNSGDIVFTVPNSSKYSLVKGSICDVSGDYIHYENSITLEKNHIYRYKLTFKANDGYIFDQNIKDINTAFLSGEFMGKQYNNCKIDRVSASEITAYFSFMIPSIGEQSAFNIPDVTLSQNDSEHFLNVGRVLVTSNGKLDDFGSVSPCLTADGSTLGYGYSSNEGSSGNGGITIGLYSMDVGSQKIYLEYTIDKYTYRSNDFTITITA